MVSALQTKRPLFLASVTSADEAWLALQGGADVIDAKDPSRGALGALPLATIKEIVTRVAGRVPVSATVGDLPADPRIIVAAAEAVAATGVNVVKVGFFGDADPKPAITALDQANLGTAQRVAVLMADRDPDFSVLPHLAQNGFLGVMLDTADKTSGSLTDAMPIARLHEFLQDAKSAKLVAGLAGSLRLDHVAMLAALDPDILGFRGALCAAGRKSAIEAARISDVRRTITAIIEKDSVAMRSVA